MSQETTEEVQMAAMTQGVRRVHAMPRNVSGRAPVRVLHPTQNEQPVPTAKVRQWNDLIPGTEVSKLRYIVELDGGSAPLARVILP
jgi:hypothetical protein